MLEPLGADRTLAKRKLSVTVARMQAVIEQARQQVTRAAKHAHRQGKPLSVRQMALAHYHDQMRFDDELRNTTSAYSLGFPDEDRIQQLQKVETGAATNFEMAAVVGLALNKFQSRRNTSVTPDTSEWREVCRALAAAELEAISREMERDDGNFSGTPTHPFLQPEPIEQDKSAARLTGPESKKTLAELLPAFLEERGAAPATNYEHSVAIRMFDECAGKSKPVYQITKKDVIAFKQMLSEAPASASKRFPNSSLPEAIALNKRRSAPFPLLNAKTINDKWLSRLHSFLSWCVRNDIIPDNPATGVKVSNVKRTSGRLPFSPSDLAAIFSKEAFAKPLDETKWAMLVSVFAGLRASETAQLKLDSIRHERGILVFAIEEETKNWGSKRLVPVHSKLIELGIEDRIEELRKSRKTHLFPDWYKKGVEAKRAKKDGEATLNLYFPRFIPKSFNRSFLRKVGISDKRKKWHSFRHTFKTGLSLAGVPRDMRDDLCGHADNSAGAAYVHGKSVEAMRDAVEKLHFDGLDLSHLS